MSSGHTTRLVSSSLGSGSPNTSRGCMDNLSLFRVLALGLPGAKGLSPRRVFQRCRLCLSCISAVMANTSGKRTLVCLSPGAAELRHVLALAFRAQVEIHTIWRAICFQFCG